MTSVCISKADKHVHRVILGISTVGLEQLWQFPLWATPSSKCWKLEVLMDNRNGNAHGIWILGRHMGEVRLGYIVLHWATLELPRFNMT